MRAVSAPLALPWIDPSFLTDVLPAAACLLRCRAPARPAMAIPPFSKEKLITSGRLLDTLLARQRRLVSC
jgi:hypothetical protein